MAVLSALLGVCAALNMLTSSQSFASVGSCRATGSHRSWAAGLTRVPGASCRRGVTNDFLVRSGDPLAILYNDLSPQENHHVASSFTVLQREALNFFPKNSKRVRGHCRSAGCTACETIASAAVASTLTFCEQATPHPCS